MPKASRPLSVPEPTWRHMHFLNPEAFSSTVSTIYRPVVLEHAPSTQFHGGIESHQSGELLATVVEATTHELLHHVPEDETSPPDEDQLKIFVPVNGVAVLNQGGQEVTLEPGALGLLDTSRTYRVMGDAGFDCLILMLPRRNLHVDAAELTDLTATRLTSGGLDSVVVPYLTGLARNLAVLSGTAGQRVAYTTVDLLSTVLRTEVGPRLSETDSRRAEVLETARQYITDHLEDRSLSPVTIASALFVSPRHLHAVFSSADTTVAAFIRSERLEASRRDLADPMLTHIGIADLAARWGFSDGPHFTRAFKASFGVTPSEFRRRSVRHSD